MGVPIAADVHELIAMGIDAASVAVPSEHHEAVGVTLAEAGLPSRDPSDDDATGES